MARQVDLNAAQYEELIKLSDQAGISRSAFDGELQKRGVTLNGMGFDYKAQHPYIAALSSDAANMPAHMVGAFSDMLDKASYGLAAKVGYRPENDPFRLAMQKLNAVSEESRQFYENEADRAALANESPAYQHTMRTIAGLLGFAKAPETLGQVATMEAIGRGLGNVASAVRETPAMAGLIKSELTATPYELINKGDQGIAPMIRPPVDVAPPTPTIPPASAPLPEVPSLNRVNQPEVPEAVQFAKERGYPLPRELGTEGQTKMQAMQDASHAKANRLYDKANELLASEHAAAATGTADSLYAVVSKLQDEMSNVPELLQNSTIRKVLDAGKDVASKRPSDFSAIQTSASDLLGLKRAANAIYEKNWDNPTGYVAKEIGNAASKDFTKIAPEDVSRAFKEADSFYKEHADTYYNKHVQGYLSESPEEAHLAANTVEASRAIKAAGGKGVADTIRLAMGHDLAHGMALAEDAGTHFTKTFAKNYQNMIEHFSPEDVANLHSASEELQQYKGLIENAKRTQELANAASKAEFEQAVKTKTQNYQDALAKAEETNKVSEKAAKELATARLISEVPLSEKLSTAAKKNTKALVGGAIGKAVGGPAGSLAGTALGHLMDLEK